MDKPIAELARKIRVVIENRVVVTYVDGRREVSFSEDDWDGFMRVLNWLERETGWAAPENIAAVISDIPED